MIQLLVLLLLHIQCFKQVGIGSHSTSMKYQIVVDTDRERATMKLHTKLNQTAYFLEFTEKGCYETLYTKLNQTAYFLQFNEKGH